MQWSGFGQPWLQRLSCWGGGPTLPLYCSDGPGVLLQSTGLEVIHCLAPGCTNPRPLAQNAVRAMCFLQVYEAVVQLTTASLRRRSKKDKGEDDPYFKTLSGIAHPSAHEPHTTT